MKIESIKRLLAIYKNDPVKKCKIFKAIGCSHVDGLMCDFPQCSIIKKYYEDKKT